MRINHLLLFFIALLIVPDLYAQKVDVKSLEGLKIRNLGPAGMSGRVTSIDVVASNTDVIYIGTASGGVWKSESGGIDWEPIFDEQPLQSIGAVAINQNNPDEIWVGTGEGNPRNSQNSGSGIYRSLDAGKTWKFMGLKNTKTIHRIIIHRDDSNTIFVGAQGSAWGPNEERGIYKTTDGGETWEKVLYINDETGCADLVVDPSNPNKLMAAMWEYGRKPWTFNSGGAGSGLYVTVDGGKNWTRRTAKDGLPKGKLGRIGLAIAPSKPNIVYALVEAQKNALYKSMDGGVKWTKIADKNIGNRPFYYADIFVDPQNENRLYNLYSLVSKSEDGGKTFEILLPYYRVHPDHHAFWINPHNSSHLINGNDGGLNISKDGGKTWRFIENLPLAQFYHINYDMDIPYNIGGGMQDNGSWIGPSQVWKSGGIRNSDWQMIYFGDGFDVGLRPDNNRYAYAMSQGGRLGYTDRETGLTQTVVPTHPDGVELRFNWNAAFAQNPFEPKGIYYGSQFVHKSMDCGQSWEIISPDLTTNDTTKQKQSVSGGLTIDNTQAENFTTIIAIGPSPVDENVIWVGTDDGNLQLTKDGGQTWTNLASKLKDAKPGSWIPYIEVSQKNAGEAFVVVNDYRRNDWRPMVYHTADYGATFKRIVDEKQVEGHALSIVQDPIEPNLLWLGTDYGLYMSIDKGTTWNKWMNDYPSVSTSDLKIHPREHDLIVGTFGRSAWILDDIRPIRAVAKTNGEVLAKDFSAFESPDAYLASYRGENGVMFQGDAHFVGSNRRRGAMLTLWVKPQKEEDEKAKGEEEENKSEDEEGEKKTDKKKKNPKKVKIDVYDAGGVLVRNFSTKVDTGMNRIYWSLGRNGVRYPSRREAKPDADPPLGRAVLPGTYKLVFTYGDLKDSTEVRVLQDPRLKVPMEDLQAKDAVYASFNQIVEKATMSFKQLQDARKSIKTVESAMANADEEVQKEIKKMGKDLGKSIAKLEKLYMMPTGLKGIQRTSDNLSGVLRQARSYIRALEGAPNQAANRLLERSRVKTQEVLEQVNNFFATEFAEYQRTVEGKEYPLFKEREVVELR